MTYYLTTLKDVAGNNYLGINIPTGIVDPFLNELKDILHLIGAEYIWLGALQRGSFFGHKAH